MAVGHYAFNDQTQHGRILRRVMSGAQSFLEEGIDLKATMAQMLSGDGTSDAHYTYMTAKFGFPDDATTHAAYNEFLSVMGKITVDSSVSSVNAAIVQAMAKFR